MRKIKYLAAYLIPFSTLLALILPGLWTYSTVFFAFGIIPGIELFSKGNNRNLSEVEESKESANKFYDILLYLNIPIQFALVLLFCLQLESFQNSNFELVGMVLSLGISIGSIGINVAHELGHRPEKYHHILAIIQLVPGHYTHFFIEHNKGHHKHVATPEDPATARLGENIYAFWLRSSIGSYLNAWKIEIRSNGGLLSPKNKMIWLSLLQITYLLTVFAFFGAWITAMVIITGIVGFLLLESVNYIEHYGLVRAQLPNGRYETVKVKHSWNSNHSLGRIVLYELTRHSAHHYRSTIKYQVLKHYDESPQLPYGYPGSILLALVPPLWFYLINPKVPKENNLLIS